MADLTGSKLKLRKGMKDAGVPEDGDEDVAPTMASPTADIPPAPPAGTRFGKPFTAAEKKMQADKLTEVLRRRL